ncbi:MAG: aminopeptidase P family protein [Rhodospirillaceae bacterium]|jgi:Xaa-Pro aminopeptidase|nr:aminopeptidase P family protein [Rhodospirillaceae bacterium]MBT5245459.1 aminopeptidase P family protein [Rhodospirillaceae bacterium]MBT5562615.1 aminopeptidase P family protein [Rhodospirillaceae bacterium]MBT6242527.1 aminopeptidase P family protein [Rhodospirillaceae bacterium]MBT7136579.1 aminopeptidase P family protein [Rhodospirillaceae bacterium]
MNSKPPASPIKATQELLAEAAFDGFIVPYADEFQGEYISENNMRLKWLTGFTGSAGTAILYAGKVHLFVDGRYTLQAPEQVDQALVEVHGHRDPTPVEWLAKHVAEQARIGYDPRLHSIANIQTLKAALKKKQVEAVAIKDNPIDRLWCDRPAPPDGPVSHHDIAYTGRSSDDKIDAIAEALKQSDAEAIVLNEMDAIAWTFNIRGGDTAFTPLTQATALIHANGHADLFADPGKFSAQTKATLGNRTTLYAMEMFAEKLDEAGSAGLKVGLDKSTATDWISNRLREAGAEIVYLTDPSSLQRALKNDTEIRGAHAAHRRDALAMIRFLKWFDKASTSMPLTEMDIEVKILEFREQIDLFQGLSFATIAGAGPNGAIVHYMASPETNRQLETGSLLLLDSGGQYLDGTTDITRTLAVGVPSDEMRKHFTLVLKGHIAIASARFPVGTNGGQLDALARQHLWRDGLNYQHGTGHGVGSFLGVHEGPHRLAAGSTVPFEAGMFISNEPGLYLPNQYGIRIESLFVVIDSTIDKFLEFAPLSVVPMDRKLIDVSLMNKQELAWLDDYYKKVFDYAAEHLDEDERQWLAATCAPLSA